MPSAAAISTTTNAMRFRAAKSALRVNNWENDAHERRRGTKTSVTHSSGSHAQKKTETVRGLM